ncbi:MAG: M50 family metallopeptidase, partial [Candidatus Omnitrophica bacterium]|nr:M50 family metallopeptidase [Candidatus Omnitrophota bacterium]
MLKKIVKLLLGVMLVPASVAFSISLFEQIRRVQPQHNPQNYFLYGVSSYILLHLVFFKPVYLYVWGHEAMHVLAAWLCGGKVSSFKVSSAGGSINTSKSNFFIALAP